MNTLKINIPEGFKIKSFNESTGEVSFEPIPKDIKERIKTFDDVLNELGIKATLFGGDCLGLSKDEIAYKQLKLIAQALNEGWTPDWTNSNEYKYYPWFEMGSASGVGFSYYDFDDWFSNSSVGSHLCFKSSELAKYAGKQFESIYKEFLTINE